ncbi:MAG TPA: hypothetical protein VGA08_03015 [Candidatus Saccharimonadales bacterium]
MTNKIFNWFRSTERGFILPIFVITMVLVSLMIVAINSGAVLNYRTARQSQYDVSAQLAADSGLDRALVELTNDSNWPGSGSEVEVVNTDDIRTTFETVVSDGATASQKTIAVTARTYSPSTESSPDIVRRFEIDVEAITSGTGPASVVSGVGGLVLNNNAKISGGDVLVNGKVTINNNAQIGLSTNPVNVRVAHQSCPNPPNGTYPQVCASGENGQPISIGNNGKIYGDVRATNQTDGAEMFNPGLIPNQTFDPVDLPDYDRDAQKAAVATTQSPATATCSNNETKTWPANLKITGNVTFANNCTINVSGDVWITGNLNTGNNSRLVISSSLGTTTPTIMIDGSSGFSFGNNGQIIPNSSGTGAQVITYWSADTSCSPDCTDVTGSSLAASQSTTTINLSNNGSAQNSIFYARWSRVVVSNNGGLGAVAGQTVQLGNNAVISFTAAIPGSDNLITTWVKRGFMRVYQ